MVSNQLAKAAALCLTASQQAVNLECFSRLKATSMDRIKTEVLTGAQIVVRCLQAEGVDVVFGYPGGAVLWIYDELFKQDKVKHVLVRHEQGAAHAADGYSRSSNKVGVCLVTSGPGL